MSFTGLCNRTCSIKRLTKTTGAGAGLNAYGEDKKTISTIATAVPIRFERVGDRDTLEAYRSADTVRGLFCLFMPIGTNIRGGDIIFAISPLPADLAGINDSNAEDDLVVLSPEDAGGQMHHLEVYAKFRQELK